MLFRSKLKNNCLTESNLIHILGTQTKIQTYEVFEENQTAYYAVEFTGELIFEEKSTSSNEPQTPRNNTKRMNTTFEKLFSPKSRFSLKHGRKEAVDPTDPYLADDFEDYDPEDFILEEEDIKERLPMFCYCILNIFLGMELYTQWGFLQHITGHVKAVSLTICFAVCLLCLLWEKEYPKTRIILLIPYLIMPFSIYLINHFLLINFETINYGTLFLINLLATLPGYMIRYAMRKIKRLIRFI